MCATLFFGIYLPSSLELTYTWASCLL